MTKNTGASVPAIDPSQLQTRAGRPAPLGATIRAKGVNFAVFSEHATRAWLALFNAPDDAAPVTEIELNPATHRFGDVWTVFVDGLQSGCIYAWRFEGPRQAKQGHRYDSAIYLLDPYAHAVVNNTKACRPRPLAFESATTVESPGPRHSFTESVIYEVHVRGFTRHETSGVEHKGTYQGLIEKIPYLTDLGITTVELLPIHECGEAELPYAHPDTGEQLINYWGYNTIGFFAPAARYASDGALGGQVAEFRAMVDALHAAGIEVILDVVYNHTAEGNHLGPTMSFRGIDNKAYYQLEGDGKYANYSGCGNTLNCNHPVVSDLIVDSLRYWVTEMGVDGFRFDLATILNRDVNGKLLDQSPLVKRISEDPVLRGAKLIAEAWDVGGGYQVGRFGDRRWADWNDRYRDDVRRFWRGDPGTKSDFALRLTGSPDVYQSNQRTPMNSINFITAHDGFTLRDLVSYNEKHNWANGEENQDGTSHNLSWNCGVEGETDNAEVLELRMRMQKTFLASLVFSLGVPMILAGDEFSRTQRGNNNAYCHDNELAWLDWGLAERNHSLLRFCKHIIRLRKANPVFRRSKFFDGKPMDSNGRPDIAWFDAMGAEERWTDPDHVLACRIHADCNDGRWLYLMFNPSLVAREFTLPEGAWHELMNTANISPDDITEDNEGAPVNTEKSYVLGRKAVAMLGWRP